MEFDGLTLCIQLKWRGFEALGMTEAGKRDAERDAIAKKRGLIIHIINDPLLRQKASCKKDLYRYQILTVDSLAFGPRHALPHGDWRYAMQLVLRFGKSSNLSHLGICVSAHSRLPLI